MSAISSSSPSDGRRSGRDAVARAVAFAGSLSLGLGLFSGAQPAHAAGFLNSDQSPTAVGLAGAVVARPDDASAIFYNPAGLGYQAGLSVLAGASIINLKQQVTDPSGAVFDSKGGTFVAPTLFVAARVTDRIALGVGVYANHANNANWDNPDDPRDFPGRYKALRVSLQGITINPTLAVRPIPELSFGAGIDLEIGQLELVRALALGGADARIALAGNTVGVGGNIGVLTRLLDGRLNFGLAFRSALNLHFQDMQLGASAPPGVAFTFPYTKGSTDVGAPHIVTFGVAGKPIRFLTISADFIATLWSDNRSQTLTLSDDQGSVQSSVSVRNWRDTYSGRFGLEGDLGTVLKPGSKLWPKLRLGFGYDPSPIPAQTIDTSSPDSDRFLVSAGLSLGYRGIGSLELGYTAQIFRGRTSENPDLPLSYNSMINTFSAAINLQLERLLGQRSAAFAGRQLETSPEAPIAAPDSSTTSEPNS